MPVVVAANHQSPNANITNTEGVKKNQGELQRYFNIIDCKISIDKQLAEMWCVHELFFTMSFYSY